MFWPSGETHRLENPPKRLSDDCSSMPPRYSSLPTLVDGGWERSSGTGRAVTLTGSAQAAAVAQSTAPKTTV